MTRTQSPKAALVALALSALAGCSGEGDLSGVTPSSHAFPIKSGDHAFDCATCHTNPATFVEFTCVDCHTHEQVVTDRLHTAVEGYAYASASCLECHRSVIGLTYTHGGITGDCAVCHDDGAPFSARPPAILTSANSSLPPKVTFDHAHGASTGDCGSCHTASKPAYATWAGGRYHLAGAAAPSTCLPCHADERPTGTAGWLSTTYTTSPFDYGTNAAGIPHGNAMDCAACHANPGTGVWGSTQNWAGGHFPHGAASGSPTTCLPCHMSQRPDLLPGTTPAAVATLLGFNHATDGTGDCYGCHQATVAAGSYVHLKNPATGQLPGGDWKGGSDYPGAELVADPNSKVTVTELILFRSGALVTGYNTTTVVLYGGMSHVSTAIPAALFPGPAGNPDRTKCALCHVTTGGVLTLAGGKFHEKVTALPAPQPTSHCADCHAPMWPGGIVLGGGSNLKPMDHSATFVAPVSIGGVVASSVNGIDCSRCHHQPGTSWADGVFHANIGAAVPSDCTLCHYPLMATAAADVASGTRYTMAHRAPVITAQACGACHTTALAQSTQTPATAALWKTGAYHPGVSAQPNACLACHAGSAPAGLTQSSVTYPMPAGGTATNGKQWMNHRAGSVQNVECAVCHASDAKASGSAWSTSAAFHANRASPGSCQVCHGLSNGNGAVPGAGNNMPAGLTTSSTVTSASAASGVAGAHDQIDHADVNVTTHDCNFCHTKSAPGGGSEWAQATFHKNFTTASPLVMNGTTGRCSTCHMNLRPGAGLTSQDHSTFTAAAGTKDCSACHTWPGLGTPTAPNWLGAGAPQFITVGGFAIPNPPSATARTQAGLANLPHPSTTTNLCTACHAAGAGGKHAIGYDHASSVSARACATCHEAGSDLVGTPWNGATVQTSGAGDTRPTTLAGITTDGKKFGDLTHFFLDRAGAQVDCYHCHKVSTGLLTTSTGTTYRSRWKFNHPPESPVVDFCYQCHPTGRG